MNLCRIRPSLHYIYSQKYDTSCYHHHKESTQDHYHFEASVYDSEMLDWWLLKFEDAIWDIEKIDVDQ